MRSRRSRPAVSSTDSCDVPGTSGIHTTAVVSFTAPTIVLSGHTYHAAFRTRVDAGPAEIRSTPVNTLAPLFRTPTLMVATGHIGVPYQPAFHATGAPTPTYFVSAGELPKGLTLDPNGTLNGAPTGVATFVYFITATNSVSPDAKQKVTQRVVAGKA